MRIVVLGVGNILPSDEGIGVRAVEELGRRYCLPPEVEPIDGGTSAMEAVLPDPVEAIAAATTKAGVALPPREPAPA